MNNNNRLTKRYEGKAFIRPDVYPRPECGSFPCSRVGTCKFSFNRYRKKCPFVMAINRLADLEDRIERGELLEVVPDERN